MSLLQRHCQAALPLNSGIVLHDLKCGKLKNAPHCSFQKFRSESTKKQSCGGGACLIPLRANTGNPPPARGNLQYAKKHH